MVALLPIMIGLGFVIGYIFLVIPLDMRSTENSQIFTRGMLDYHELQVAEIVAPNDTVPTSSVAVIQGQVHPAILNIADFQTAHYLVTPRDSEQDSTVVIVTWADPDLVGTTEDINRMIRMLRMEIGNDPLQIDAGIYRVSADGESGSLSQGIIGELTFDDNALGGLGILGVPAIVSLHEMNEAVD